MLRLSRIILIVLVIVVMASFLPGFFWKAFDKKVNTPMILYSVVRDEFVYRQSDEYGKVVFRDESGNDYDRIAYENLLPFFYYRDLHKWGTLPEKTNGQKVDFDICRNSYQSLRVVPDYLHRPGIDIYPLYESQSVFSSLEEPLEMFRLTDRMEFITASTNKVNEDLSSQFTKALETVGFVFPRKYIAGNPTTRKPFDEGYFVVDDNDVLFHVKMVEGKPLCVNTKLRPESGIRYISIRENSRKEFYGVLITGDNNVNLISYDQYKLIKLPLDGFDPDTMTMMMVADLLNRTFIYKEREGDKIHCVLTDLDYKVQRTYTYPIDRGRVEFVKALSQGLFPFTIETKSANSDYILFDFQLSGLSALAGVLAALIIFALVRMSRSIKLKDSWIDWFIVLITGPYGLIAVLIVGKEPSSP